MQDKNKSPGGNNTFYNHHPQALDTGSFNNVRFLLADLKQAVVCVSPHRSPRHTMYKNKMAEQMANQLLFLHFSFLHHCQQNVSTSYLMPSYVHVAASIHQNLSFQQIKDDTGLSVEMCWNKEDRIGSDFTLRFRSAHDKKAFLLTVCHVAPDAQVLALSDTTAAHTDDTSPTHASPAPHSPPAGSPSRRPIPPRPSFPREDVSAVSSAGRGGSAESHTHLGGDITGEELSSMVQMLCCGAPAHTTPDYLRPDEVGSGGGGALQQMLGATRVPFDDFLPEYPARPALRSERVRQQLRGGSLRSSLPPSSHQHGVSTDAVSDMDATVALEADPNIHILDVVEVRDHDTDPWKSGVVRAILGDPLLKRADEDPNFYVLASPTANVRVQPGGGEKAFLWRQVRMPREAELALRRQEKEVAEAEEERAVAAEEERQRVRSMIGSMEMRLEQELMDTAVSQHAAAQRVAARQRDNDPRLSLSPSASSPQRGFSRASPRIPGSAHVGSTHSPQHSQIVAPEDAALLGPELFVHYTRWRRADPPLPTHDAARLLKALKDLHMRMVRGSAPRLGLDRVSAMVGNVGRELRMLKNKSVAVPLDGAVEVAGSGAVRPTVPVPFHLSSGSKPPILMSTADFRGKLQDASRRAEQHVSDMRGAFAEVERNRAEPVQPCASPPRQHEEDA